MGKHQFRRSHSLRPRHHLLLGKVARHYGQPCSATLEALIEAAADAIGFDVTAEEVASFKAAPKGPHGSRGTP